VGACIQADTEECAGEDEVGCVKMISLLLQSFLCGRGLYYKSV
jgi:hypothetical protein